MNKMIMNRLTMLAVTLMASMACFAQGKFTTNIPPGKQKDQEFDYLSLKYKVLEVGAGYITKVIGFADCVDKNPALMKTGGNENEWTPYTVEIVHYVPAGGGSNGSPAMVVQEVAEDVFKTVNTELAGYVKTLIIDYSDDPTCQEKSEYVALPETGNTFAGLTALEKVYNNTPKEKVQSIPAGTFDKDVYTYGTLYLPEGAGVAKAYSKVAGWQPFLLRYVGNKLMGDSDNNKKIKTSDANYLKVLIMDDEYDEMYDFDGSGKLKSADLNFLKNIILSL